MRLTLRMTAGYTRYLPSIFAAHIGANFSMTFPAAKGGQALQRVLPPRSSHGIPMAGPFAPNLRTSFAIPKRLLSVTWRTEGEVTLQSNQALLCKCQAYTVRLLGRACLIPQRGQKPSEAPGGFAMGMLWECLALS